MPHQYLNPPTLGQPHGWSQVVVTQGSRTIYISGQVGIDERGNVVGRGDLRTQTEQAWKNIKLALEAAGATFADVVKTNLYVVGLKPEHVPILRDVRAQFISPEHAPASTLVGVTALVGVDWLIEIEAVAVVQ